MSFEAFLLFLSQSQPLTFITNHTSLYFCIYLIISPSLTCLVGGGLAHQPPRHGAGCHPVEDVVVAGVQVGGQQRELLQPHGATLLRLHRHVVDEERRRVVLGQHVDGEPVADAVAAVADAENDVVARGVAVGVVVDHHALPQVPHAEHEPLPAWAKESAIRLYTCLHLERRLYRNVIRHSISFIKFKVGPT